MSTDRCWAMHRDGSRCVEPAAPESRFCQSHGRNGGPSPLMIWREPRPEPTAPPLPSVAPPPVSPTPTPAGSAATEDGAGEAVDAADSEGLSWFMGLLRQMMTEVMAGEAPPLQKANAVARLGNLYLRAHRTVELTQANKALRRQAAALEERLAASEAQLAALAQTAPSASIPVPEAEAARLAAEPVVDRVPVGAGSEVPAISAGPTTAAGASWDVQSLSEAPPFGG